MSIITKINKILARKEKINLIYLTILIMFGALLETFALAVISPFISILMDQSEIVSNLILRSVFEILGFNEMKLFLIFLSLFLMFIYVFRGFYVYILTKIQYRYIGNRRVSLSTKLMKTVISKPYLYFTNKNVAELQKTIVDDVNQFLVFLTAILLFLTDVAIVLIMIVYLFIVSYQMTLVVLVLSSICAAYYFSRHRNRLTFYGQDMRNKFINMTKALLQGIGGIKEVKVLRRESYFENAYRNNGNQYARIWSKYSLLTSSFRLILETICFGGAFAAMGAYIYFGSNIISIVPQLSLFVLAAFRLLPCITRVVNNVSTIIYSKASVEAIYNTLFSEAGLYYHAKSLCGSDFAANKNIVINDLSFTYPSLTNPILQNVSCEIPERRSVAFIGTSGVGKTTLIDLLLGLMTPQSGSIIYNGKSIYSQPEEWASVIGYIPQQIYLLDESIRRNISFGIPDEQIDNDRLWSCLEMAQLKDFVLSLPERIETIVGDRGIRLSGGQRQRIGIARALYANPSVLVLDEATSSLDNDTENAVMDAIIGLHGDKTLIIVAHRLSTIEHCDIVYQIENGRVVKIR